MLFKSILSLFVISISLNLWAQSYTSNVNFDDGIDFDSLAQKIVENKVYTLEETLDLIPEDFFDNYVLMYRSRSLQEAQYLSPRAIVFGRSAKFIISFNGHSQQRGFNNLEIIQFREKTHSWEFREISYLENQLPHISEANPKKCLECHQSLLRKNVDPRPNWEPYNFWPGSYASMDVEIRPVLKTQYEKYLNNQSPSLPSVMNRFLPQDFILVEEQSLEQQKLSEFHSEIKPRNRRYKKLGNFNLRAPLNLTKSLVILNMRRVTRIIKEELGENFEKYKYALLGLGNAQEMSSSKGIPFQCSDLYLPESLFNEHLSRALKIKDLDTKHYTRRPNTFRWEFGLGAGLDILLLPLGINTQDWSMDFRTDGRFSFSGDRFASPHHSATHFRDAAALVFSGDPVLDLNCKELKIKSEEAFNALESSGQLHTLFENAELNALTTVSRPLIDRCISCHVDFRDDGVAPYIPFDNFEKLKPLLSQKKYPRGNLFDEIYFRTSDHSPSDEKMPPAGILDRDRLNELIDDLRALKDS